MCARKRETERYTLNSEALLDGDNAVHVKIYRPDQFFNLSSNCSDVRVDDCMTSGLCYGTTTGGQRSARVGEWRSLVAHLVWDQRVAGSNPVSPTIFFRRLPPSSHNVRSDTFISGLDCISLPRQLSPFISQRLPVWIRPHHDTACRRHDQCGTAICRRSTSSVDGPMDGAARPTYPQLIDDKSFATIATGGQ